MGEGTSPNLELRLRERELDLREREVVLKEREQRRWLRNPVFVGLIAAALGLFGNATVAWFQNENVDQLERKQFQYQLLLEATKTNNPDEAAKRLKLLLRSGFIDDPDRRISYFIENPKDIPLGGNGDRPPRGYNGDLPPR